MNPFISLKYIDWRLMAAVIFLVLCGLISLSSSSPDFLSRQLLWFGAGLVLVFLIINFDWRPFVNYRGLIVGTYFFIIGLLLFVKFFGPAINGAHSWIIFGNFQIQPSEFMKILLIIFYSLFFSRRHAAIGRASNIVVSFLYFLLPGILIAIQPDFGNVLILFAVWLGFLFVSGIKWRHLVIVLLLVAIASGLMWNFYLKDYQKARVLGFLFPGRDPLGFNYNVIQAKIAIGSAGIFGKGFGQGTQVQLGFLPEKQTDFIFAAIIEEWGIAAGFLIITVFLYMIFRIIKIGFDASNNFDRFICLGAIILFLAQFVLNVGSNLGLTPVVGVTFPFVSYGGSSLLTNLILIGIIESLYLHRSL